MTTTTITPQTTIATPTTIDDLAASAGVLAAARGQLGELVQALNAGLEALKADAMPDIRAAIGEASVAWAELEALIRLHPELFVKPRTVAAHGIVFGLEKGKGAIEIADADRTAELIRKHLPELAPTLLAVKAVPVRKAIAQLSAADCRRIGVQLVDATDQVVIRPAPSDVDKLVRALVRAELDEN